MTQANILELARQGDVKAIASLMNSQLQFKNVTAKVIFNNGCLEVTFQSAQVPEQENLVKYVRQEIMGLKTACIKKVKIYGFQKGNNSPLWNQELNLEFRPTFTSSFKKDLLNTTCKITNLHESNLEQKYIVFIKKIYQRYLITIFLLLVISIFIIGENQLSQQKKCAFQNEIIGKYIENCK